MSDEATPAGPKLATRSELLALSKRRYRDVPIPELGLTIRIRNLMEGERSRYEAETLTKDGGLIGDRVEDARRRLVCLTAVDENGALLFPHPDDLKALVDVDGLVTARIYDAAWEHCGFKKGDIEALVKNSGSVRVAG